jgi:hypothetical protein
MNKNRNYGQLRNILSRTSEKETQEELKKPLKGQVKKKE